MRIIAVIDELAVIRKILKHLRLWDPQSQRPRAPWPRPHPGPPIPPSHSLTTPSRTSPKPSQNNLARALRAETGIHNLEIRHGALHQHKAPSITPVLRNYVAVIPSRA